MKLRQTLFATAIACLASTAALAQTVSVFKDAGCGCCGAWVEHMRQNGFTVEASDISPEQMNALKAKAGITAATASCHTAFVEGYVIEGHVPASDVARLIEEKPEAVGLSVPGMPIGSPGMEFGTPEAYQVLLLERSGTTTVFAEH